jgi:hypothetical protein
VLRDVKSDTAILAPLLGHSSPIVSLALSSPAATLCVAAGAEDGSVLVWNAKQGVVVSRLQLSSPPLVLALSQSGRRLAAAHACADTARTALVSAHLVRSDLQWSRAKHTTFGAGFRAVVKMLLLIRTFSFDDRRNMVAHSLASMDDPLFDLLLATLADRWPDIDLVDDF